MDERDALLRFYDQHARDLPWRRTRDPYAIWVSEVMLQQTRVETVLRYWAPFIARFPDAPSLAAASDDDVLSMWSGLGYYRRARLLHRGARELALRHGGLMPEDPAARRALPGIGRYTAGAIGSIAFNREEPIVDGNVARVFSRLRGIETPLGSPQTESRLWDEAERMVRGARPGALNQALMELGATLCSKGKPSCTNCPLTEGCIARKTDRTDMLPIARARSAPRSVDWVAVIAEARGHLWMIKNEGSLFGGLWSVPTREGKDARAARRALKDAGLACRSLEPIGELEHVLTHRRIQVRVFGASGVRAIGDRSHRVERGQLGGLGISTLTKRILAIKP